MNLRGFALDLEAPNHANLTPILAPGFGAQGAELADARRLFGAAAPQLIASVSRSVLGTGAVGIAAAIESATAELGSAFGRE